MRCQWSDGGATLGLSESGMAPAKYSGTSSRGRSCDRAKADMSSGRERAGNGPVRTAVSGRTLLITIDRPPANAIDVTTSHALYAAFDRLRCDPDLRVGLLTAAGERFFCAGWDLKAAAAGESVEADHGPGGFAGLTEFFDIGKPVIAAVNGMALGGGFELVLAADLVVAADHAEFALTEVTLGLVADAGGVLRLPKRLPRAIALEYLLTGRRLTAADAVAWGLVNQVVPDRDLIAAALDL